MKKLVFTYLIAACGLAAFAQGTVQFANSGEGLNAPIYSSDAVTKVSGANYRVTLLAGVSPGSMTPVATSSFLANNPGYFDGGMITLTNVLPGANAFLQIAIWDTNGASSFSEAQACNCTALAGRSSLFSVTTGDPTTTPPTAPAVLRPLGSFSLDYLDFPAYPPPTVTIRPSTTNTLSVAWGNFGSKYTVEQSPDLNPTNWVPVTSAIEKDNFRLWVTVPKPQTRMFYRLVQH